MSDMPLSVESKVPSAASRKITEKNIDRAVKHVIKEAQKKRETVYNSQILPPDSKIIGTNRRGHRPEGKAANYVYSTGLYYDVIRPISSQTHPDPKDFKINRSASPNNPKSYRYVAQTPGQILRHEAEHDVETREEWIEKGKIPDANEYKLDMKAMEGIKKAWKKWEKSGFTDNSGYYFVFSLPPEEGGGYILTENKSSSGSSAPSNP